MDKQMEGWRACLPSPEGVRQTIKIVITKHGSMPYGATSVVERNMKRKNEDNSNTFSTASNYIEMYLRSFIGVQLKLPMKGLERKMNERESGLSSSWPQYLADGRPTGRPKVNLTFAPKSLSNSPTPPPSQQTVTFHKQVFLHGENTHEISSIHP